MRAAVRDRYGSPDVVTVQDVERPEPTGDRVLVRVVAASVNRVDLDWLYPRPAITRLALGLRGPRNHRMGVDVAGVVESVGSEVKALRIGDRVYGDLINFGAGTLAEYVCPPERALREMPTEMSFEQAATLPHSGVLAAQGLRVRGKRAVKSGDRVMIVGASGNVGPFAVQMAKARGADVTAVASAAKLDFVRALGADRVIDYRQIDPRHTGEQYDWIIDVDAHDSLLSWRKSLRPGGVYSAMGGSARWLASLAVAMPATRLATDKTMGMMLWWKPFNPDDVATLEAMVAAGSIKPVIDRRFKLDDAVEALRYLDSGKARGKVLVEP